MKIEKIILGLTAIGLISILGCGEQQKLKLYTSYYYGSEPKANAKNIEEGFADPRKIEFLITDYNKNDKWELIVVYKDKKQLVTLNKDGYLNLKPFTVDSSSSPPKIVPRESKYLDE